MQLRLVFYTCLYHLLCTYASAGRAGAPGPMEAKGMDVDVDWTCSTPHLLCVIYVMVLHTLVGVPHIPCVPPCCHTTVRHNAGVQTNVAVRTVATQTAVATQSAEQLAANRAGEEDAGELDAVACSSIGWKYPNCGLCSGAWAVWILYGSLRPLSTHGCPPVELRRPPQHIWFLLGSLTAVADDRPCTDTKQRLQRQGALSPIRPIRQ